MEPVLVIRRKPIEAGQLRALRSRTSLLLLAGVSVGSTAFIISMTVTALAAESIVGDPTWSGVPVAAAVLGAAGGTPVLSAVMVRWGRRRGLIGAYALAALGGLVACLATTVASLVLLIAGVFMVGVGNSANALTRYVAADLQTPDRRATMMGGSSGPAPLVPWPVPTCSRSRTGSVPLSGFRRWPVRIWPAS